MSRFNAPHVCCRSLVLSLGFLGMLASPLVGQDAPNPATRRVDKPMYLHWIKPSFRGKDTPRHLLAIKVTSEQEFDVEFADTAFQGRKLKLKGRIQTRGGKHFGAVDGSWLSATRFTGEFVLDRPHRGEVLAFSGAYFPTQLVLSHERSGEQVLKLVQQEPQPKRVAKLSPARELVLSMNSIQFMLDLDSGETMDPPATSRPEQAKMDIKPMQVQPYQIATGLDGLSLRGFETLPQSWNASAKEVQKALATKKTAPLSKLPYQPARTATFFFQTRDGSEGVLQILEQTKRPVGLKVRYKTVQYE